MKLSLPDKKDSGKKRQDWDSLGSLTGPFLLSLDQAYCRRTHKTRVKHFTCEREDRLLFSPCVRPETQALYSRIRGGAWSFRSKFCRSSIFPRFYKVQQQLERLQGCEMYFCTTRVCVLTLKPSNLGSRAVALLVAGGDAEDDSWLSGVVDVSVGEAGRLHQARRVGSTIHPHEG